MASFPPSEIAYEESRAFQSHQAIVYGVSSTFYIIAVVAVLVRLCSRKLLNTHFALDDYLIVCALIPSIPFTAATLSAAKYGVGRHAITLTPEDAIEGAKWNIVNVFAYGFTITLIKLSILALYNSIFGSTSPKFRIMLMVLAIYTLLWVLGVFLGYGLSCQPFWRYWSLTESCETSKTYAYTGAIFDCVGDVLIFSAPQWLIWKLQMPWRRQLAVGGVFCLGLIATAMAIVKAIYAGGAPNVAHPLDASWNGVTALVANSLEVYLAMICACLPALPGLASWVRTEGVSNVASKIASSTASVFRVSSRSQSYTSNRRSGSETSPDRVKEQDSNIHVHTNISVTTTKANKINDIEMQRQAVSASTVKG